jgi:hypothetical protein
MLIFIVHDMPSANKIIVDETQRGKDLAHVQDLCTYYLECGSRPPAFCERSQASPACDPKRSFGFQSASMACALQKFVPGAQILYMSQGNCSLLVYRDEARGVVAIYHARLLEQFHRWRYFC